MLALLGTLAFTFGAVIAFATIGLTWARYGPAAIAQIRALRAAPDERAFDVTFTSVIRQPVLAGMVRRQSLRRAPRRVTRAAGWRAAA